MREPQFRDDPSRVEGHDFSGGSRDQEYADAVLNFYVKIH
jgi:hypothetical protein